MSTRIEQQYDCKVSFADETPRLTIPCGFATFKFSFEDTVELEEMLELAVKYRGLPWQAAEAGLRRAQREMGSYVEFETCEPCHFVNSFIPPASLYRVSWDGALFWVAVIVCSGGMLAAVGKVFSLTMELLN